MRGLLQSQHAGTCSQPPHAGPVSPLAPSLCPRCIPHPPAPRPTVKRAARQARQAGCPRPPYKHHAREALPMHALVFRAHSHIQPCTMRHPTPFSQLRRFQQPFFQRARSLPPLQMPAPSLASKKQRHARNTRVFAVARAPRRRAKRVVIVPAASKQGAAAAAEVQILFSSTCELLALPSAQFVVTIGQARLPCISCLVWCVVDKEKNPPAPPTGLDPRPERSCCKSKGFSGAGALSKVKFTLRANVTHTPQSLHPNLPPLSVCLFVTSRR